MTNTNLDWSRVPKNITKVWKRAVGSCENVKIKFCSADRNDDAAKHKRRNTSCNGIGNRNAKMVFSNIYHQFSFALKIPAFAEGAGLLDIRRRVQEVAAVLPVLHPRRGFFHLLILRPDGAQNFDEKAAAAARGIGDGEAGELRHERIGGGKIGLARAGGFANLGDERAEQSGDEAVGHRPGDAGGRVKNTLVLAVGREEHFVGLAENVLVNEAVVVVDDAALKGFAPFVHAEDGFEQAGKAFEIFGIFGVQVFPDGALEQFRVVVVLEEFLEVGEKLPDDAMRALGQPAFLGLFPIVLQLPVTHEAVILHRFGKDELVEKLDDEFVVLALVLETNRSEGVKPILQLLEKRAVEVGADFAVFLVADDIQQAVPDGSAFEQIGEGELGERRGFLPDIAGAVKIGIAQIGEDEVFGVLEILLNLLRVGSRLEGVTFQRSVALDGKQRFEFDDDGGFLGRVQLEIHESRTEADLRNGGGIQENFGQRPEQSFGGSFRLRSFLKFVQVSGDRDVFGFETGVRQQRRDLDLREVNQTAEIR